MEAELLLGDAKESKRSRITLLFTETLRSIVVCGAVFEADRRSGCIATHYCKIGKGRTGHGRTRKGAAGQGKAG